MSWFDKWVPGAGYRYTYVWDENDLCRKVLEAFRYDYEHEPQWYRDNLGVYFDDSYHGKLRVLCGENWVDVASGDWVVRADGPGLRYFPVPHRTFIKLAEPA